MTNFFNEEERAIALERANRDATRDVGFTVNKTHIVSAFKDWRVSTSTHLLLSVAEGTLVFRFISAGSYTSAPTVHLPLSPRSCLQ